MYLDPRLKRKNGTTMIYKQTISEEVHCNLTSTNTKKKKKTDWGIIFSYYLYNMYNCLDKKYII